MRKIVFLLIASFALVFTACNKEKIDKVNPDDLVINLNKAELQQRIEMLNFPVTFNNFKASADATPFPELWAIARILPATLDIHVWHWEHPTAPAPATDRVTYSDVAPVVGTVTFVAKNMGGVFPLDINEVVLPNQTQSMTGAGLLKDGAEYFAYFTSHIRGEVYGGEIFVVEYDNTLAGDAFPALAAQGSIFDLTADYNDLTIDTHADRLWVAGDNNARGAIVRYATIIGAGGLNDLVTRNDQAASLPTFTMSKYNMPMLGPSGNSVTIPPAHPGTLNTQEENQIWVVAGGTTYGGLVVMDKYDDTRLFTRTDVATAKHFDIGETVPGSSGSYGAFLYGAGANSKLRVFNTSIGPFQTHATYTLAGVDVTPEGKNAIDVDDVDGVLGGDVFIYCAMGDDGVYKVNAATGATTSFNGMDTYGGTGLANGLVVHGDYVYVAWGASGLVILNKNTLALVGQYNGIGSANYVAVDTSGPEPILWLGSGTGGMLMLKFVDDVS